MKCRICQCELFKIENRICCVDCVDNGAWLQEREEYTYDESEIDILNLERDEADNDGQCSMGEAFGDGCYIFICNNCGETDNVAVTEQ